VVGASFTENEVKEGGGLCFPEQYWITKSIPMINTRFLLLLALTTLARADPQVIKVGNTSYLKDAGDYINKAPILPKITATPTPSPTAKPRVSATQSATPFALLKGATDEDDEVKPASDYPPAIIHRSSLNVGRQIPVPTQYAAPQIVASQNGGVTVVPATPTTFQTVQTGVMSGTDAEGRTTVSDTDLSGVVNYGQPIQTIVPVYNQQGQQIGSQTITTPNPVLVPVTRTIQISQ
jgi:hypothetical protein